METLTSQAKNLLSYIWRTERPSSLFVITSSQTPERLLTVLSDRLEDIVKDNVSLAHVRIVASGFLLKEIVRRLQRLESYNSYYRSEATANVNNAATIWQRISSRQSQSALAQAERFEKHVRKIERVIDVLFQFIGLHMEAIEDIHFALESKRSDDLARAIVASCRQASSFQHAVSQSTNPQDLYQHVQDALRSSIGASTRRTSTNEHSQAQLGEFWNQGSTNPASSQRLGVSDVRLTLQILQTELMGINDMGRRLKRATERDLSEPWDVSRRPMRYIGLAGVSMLATNTVLVHSRFFGGTGKMEDKGQEYVHIIQSFVSMNIIEPVCGLYDQIFRSVPTSASEESVAVSKSALRGMIIEFTERNLSQVPGAVELARDGSMKAVMELIKQQAGSPIKNALTGSLGQAILLQVQKLKCDVEELMLKSKQTLRAQELNLALVALVPTMLTATAAIYLVSALSLQWMARDMDMIVSTRQTATFLLGDIHSTLLILESEEKQGENMDSILQHIRHIGTIYAKTYELEEMIEKSLIRAPPKVLRRFLEDLRLLRAPGINFESRSKQISRMMQTYQFLQCS